MKRFFYLSLTLIVLVAVASASWLVRGATADYDLPAPQSPWVSNTVSGKRVFQKDASEAESSNPFTTASEENQEQAAFDDFAPSAEYESNEFAEAVPFTPNEQAENPFGAELDALRAEPFEGPRNRRRNPSSGSSLRIRSDEAPDLDQPTRNALKEMVIQIEREADELQQLGRLKEAEHRRHVYRRLQALIERRKNRNGRSARPLPAEINLNDLRDDGFGLIWDSSFKPAKEERELLRKIEHLQRAIENLNEAGMKQKTQELQLHVDKMRLDLEQRQFQREFEERKRRQLRERKHADHAPRDDVHEALNDLRHEIRNLRNEVREMHELLEQHVKRGGKIEVELTPRNFEIEVEEELRPYDKSNIKKRGDQRNETEEIDIQARDEKEVEEEVEEEHEERPLPTPDNELPPINQPEQIEKAYLEKAYLEKAYLE
jgi:chromosome segregation ATPase